MSFGKSGGTQVTTPELTPEQRQQIQLQNEFASQTLIPTYKGLVSGATDLYNQSAGGVNKAGQNLAGTAYQAQDVLGSTGESALRTGVTGLQSLFDPNYERQQLDAALMPAQMQYQQNLANQQAAFGGAGNLGSSRSALAQTQLAGQTQAAQQAAAAGVLRDIAGQRASVGSTLAQLGQGGLGQAIGAAGQGVTASMLNQDFINKYATLAYGAPQYGIGPTGTSTTKNDMGFGVNFK
jgi:hypothetical protein